MKSIINLDNKSAFNYFYSEESYFTGPIPQYIKFKPILDYIRQSFKKSDINSTIFRNKDIKNLEGVNLEILQYKEQTGGVCRILSITNPIVYYFLCKEITEEKNWKIICDRFKEFKSRKIEVSSIPEVKNKPPYRNTKQSISQWSKGFDKRTIELSLKYKYYLNTDISNFYGSIYVHSLSWALCGKELVKHFLYDKDQKKNNPENIILGENIERLILSMQNQETMGIPLGSEVYDFLAELLLGYADILLTQSIEKEKIKDIHILRFRDDYRIFSNNKENLYTVNILLQEVLRSLRLSLNDKKTKFSENVIFDSISEYKKDFLLNSREFLLSKPNEKNSNLNKLLTGILLEIRNYPTSAAGLKLLDNLTGEISNIKIYKKDICFLVAILTEIAKLSPKSLPLSICLISQIVDGMNKEKRKALLNASIKKINNGLSIDSIEFWEQRLLLKQEIDHDYKNPICQLVQRIWTEKLVKDAYKFENLDKEYIKIWNFDWAPQKRAIGKIPYDKMIDINVIREMPIVINPAEIKIFNTYEKQGQ